MNCRRTINLLSAYVDGELTGSEMLEIRRHLSECADCADEYEATRLYKQSMSRLRTAAPRKDFAESILTKLDVVEMPAYQRLLDFARGFMHGRLSPVAAAVAASGVALMLLTAGGIDGVSTYSGMSQSSAPVPEISFVSAIKQPDDSFVHSQPLAVANVEAREAEVGPEVHFASISR